MLRGITYLSASKRRHLPDFANENVRFLFLFFAGILIGSVFANFFCAGGEDKTGIFGKYFLEQYKSVSVDNKELFLYSFWNRLKELTVVLLLCMTSMGMLVPELYLAYQGLVVGILISLYVVQYGAGGVLLYLMSIFPHYLTYGIFVILLAGCGKELYERMSARRERKIRGEKGQKENGGTHLLQTFRCVLVLLFLNMLTSYLETFVNLRIMRHVL